jgi:sugar lactone lactonase YvrE
VREKVYLKDLDVNGRITLKSIFKKSDGEMDWINLAQDGDGWWAIVNAIMNLRFP